MPEARPIQLLECEPEPDPSADRQWADRALCVGKTSLFFPPPGERRVRRETRERTARAYCRMCPVMMPCRDYAREHRENGLWGGENDEERAAAGYPPRSPQRRAVAEIGRRIDPRRQTRATEAS